MGNMAFLPIAPEVVLLAGVVLVIMSAVVAGHHRNVWGTVAGAALVGAIAMAVLQWRELAMTDSAGELYFSLPGLEIVQGPTVVMDPFSAFAGIVIFAVGLFGLIGAWSLVAKLGARGAEFVTLVLLAVAGLHMMTASSNLVLLFLGLETASISFYVLAGFTRERINSDEAAVKYFLLGSLASAVFIYGVALAFAATGSLSIYGVDGLRSFFGDTIVTAPGTLLVGIGLMIVGLAFKVSAAPFHQWAPDVYQGAPGGVVGLMAAGVKVAGFAALARILVAGFPSQIDTWAPALAIIAGLSMIIGTFLAAVQDDVKRLLAYSGVAHAGYIMTALVAGSAGIPGMWFYVATYAFMLLGAFTIAATVSGVRRGSSSLNAFAGLGRRAPELAWAMLVLLVGLGGIPFTAGFIGKVSVFTAAADAGYLWLVVLGLLTTVVGLYFYLRVVTAMFMRQPVAAEAPGTATAEPAPTTTARIVIAVAVVVTVVFGLIPWPLLDIVRDALPL